MVEKVKYLRRQNLIVVLKMAKVSLFSRTPWCTWFETFNVL